MLVTEVFVSTIIKKSYNTELVFIVINVRGSEQNGRNVKDKCDQISDTIKFEGFYR